MKKVWSIILTVLLIAGMIPSAAFASTSIDDITAVKRGSVVTLPTENVAVNVSSDGAEVGTGELVDPAKPAEMNVVFDMQLDDTVKQGDRMEISLPAGMAFTKAQNLSLTDTGTGDVIGELQVGGQDGALVFSELVESQTHSEVKSSFTASITFHTEEISVENTELSFSVFGNDFTIHIDPSTLVPDKAVVALSKDGKVDFKNNVISWTVTATPEKNGQLDGTHSFDGYVFKDVLPKNAEYVEGSFQLGTQGIPEGTESGVNVLFDSEQGTLEYAFADGMTGSQTIVYETKISPKAGEVLTAVNKAFIEKDGQIATAEKSVDFTPKLMKKSGSYDLNTHTITWTLIVNESGANLKNVVVTDQLSQGLSLADNGIVADKPLGQDATELPYYSIDADNAIQIHLGDLTGMKKIKITTVLDSSLRGDITNKASVHWDDQDSSVSGGSSGASDTISVEASVPVNKGFIEKKAGSYDFTKNEMSWDITVNQANQEIKNARIVEVFAYSNNELYGTGSVPAGVELGGFPKEKVVFSQRFADGTVLLNGAPIDPSMLRVEPLGSADGTTVQKVTISLGDISSVQNLQFKTKVTNYNGYGINGGYVISNKVLLYDDGSSVPTSAEAFTKWDSSVLEKSVKDGFDYKEHTITWQLVVNRNKVTIPDDGKSSPTVKDTLPEGWNTVAEDGSLAYEIYRGDSASGSPLTGDQLSQVLKSANIGEENHRETVTFNFHGISDTYTILLKTKLSDEGLNRLAAATESTPVKNQAVLTGKNIVSGRSVAEAVELIRANGITKTGEMETDGDGAYTGDVIWTMRVERNAANLVNSTSGQTFIVDQLEKYLEPAMDGSRYDISMTELNWDGSPGADVSDEVLQANTSYDNQKRELRIQLPNPDGNYEVQLKTRITNDEVLKLSNKVTLEGYNIKVTTQSNDIRLENLSGEAWVKLAGKITMTKKDAATGENLPGAVFKLYEADGNGGYTLLKYTKATDQNGQLIFGRLPSGTYQIVETEAPAGYKVNENSQLVTINTENSETQIREVTVTNDALTAAIQVRKTDDRGNGLQGAIFTLYDSARVAVATAESTANGTAEFSRQPAGTYYIKETRSPIGYALSGEEITARVAVDGNVTYSTGAEFSSKVAAVVNYPNKVNLAVKKVDGNDAGKLLEGAVFELRDSLGKVIETGTTDKLGMIVWSVTSGDYEVKEITAPDGYQLNSASATITVEDFPKNNGGIVVTVKDYKMEDPGEDPGEEPGDNPGEDPGNNPGGGSGGGGGSSSGGRYDPPTVDILDPDVPLSEGAPITDNPAILPEESQAQQLKEEQLYGIDDSTNPLGDKEMRDSAQNKLPKTGGAGTSPFLGLGALLMAIGAMLRRKENK